ncbi:MAG: hypothetical protein LBQ60_16375 [Bacteroidales bacterium]|jgi:hypothetical protein|nr:hypothetical protein [Bacteroidales bacterium]
MCKKLILFVLPLFLFSCSKKEPFCVTYKVSVNAYKPYDVSIIYKDTNGLVAVSIKDKNWSKEVCLSRDDLASILVRHGLNHNYNDPLGQSKAPIAVEIIHRKKTVSSQGRDNQSISLFGFDI